jgi:hypothetical protein
MLSGIGDKSILDENRIKPIVHLPGIGKNMWVRETLLMATKTHLTIFRSDHPLLVNTWKANSNDSTNLSDELHQWNTSRTGRLTDTVTNQVCLPLFIPITESAKDMLFADCLASTSKGMIK